MEKEKHGIKCKIITRILHFCFFIGAYSFSPESQKHQHWHQISHKGSQKLMSLTLFSAVSDVKEVFFPYIIAIKIFKKTHTGATVYCTICFMSVHIGIEQTNAFVLFLWTLFECNFIKDLLSQCYSVVLYSNKSVAILERTQKAC